MRLDRIELGGRKVEREGQEQSLRRRAVAGELAHHVFVQHTLVGGMLIYDGYAAVRLKQDIRVENLKKRRCLVSGVRCQGPRSKELQWNSSWRARRVFPLKPGT